MAIWNPWRGCHRYSTGCKFCYIHKGDYKKGIDTNIIKQTEKFYDPIEKNKNGTYKKSKYKLLTLSFLCMKREEIINPKKYNCHWKGVKKWNG